MEDPKIQNGPSTVTKTKSPGRVAWGKKLAAQKQLEKLSNLEKTKNDLPTEPVSQKWPMPSVPVILGFASVLVGAAALYYQVKSKPQPPISTPVSEPETDPVPKAAKNKIIDMQ